MGSRQKINTGSTKSHATNRTGTFREKKKIGKKCRGDKKAFFTVILENVASLFKMSGPDAMYRSNLVMKQK